MSDFDIVVVGAGHAGIEACLAAAKLGSKTLLVTTNINRIGYMSCNPSIGGLAKGHMVREIDVLGGQMGYLADASSIQFKRLNQRKGPAVRGSRTQNDKHLYSNLATQILSAQENLTILEGEVKRLKLSENVCTGVVLNDDSVITAKRVILTTGTFLNGVMHFGLKQIPGGRIGDNSSVGLSDQLLDFGFNVRRLKTGTPARLLKESIDWSKTIPQWGDNKIFPFSFRSPKHFQLPQLPCFLSRTNPRTHEIIRDNLHLSPMFCGVIEGTGPRYCPSIEDKITRFADRDSHQTFLEPEGLSTNLIYLQGISTSLPEEIQDQFLRTIPGLEKVKVARYGYAVEYDFIEPTQIYHSLETRTIRGLFLAGQINGTSGYEEAAAQGLIAGINAVRSLTEQDEIVLGRDEAYIGVLIDDLVTKGTHEPYRMFTSRAEHRLVLREDNTLDRLRGVSSSIGLVDEKSLNLLESLSLRRLNLLNRLRTSRINPTEEVQNKLIEIGTPALTKSHSFEELLRRNEITSEDLLSFGFILDDDVEVNEGVEIEVKYSGYIKRQNEIIEQSKRLESFKLLESLNYSEIKGLSTEEIEKLSKVKPRTLGQAQRISGVNPSAIQSIMVYLKGKQRKMREMELGVF